MTKFGDLNIFHCHEDPFSTLQTVNHAISLGYSVVAINWDVGDIDDNHQLISAAANSEKEVEPPKKKKRKKQSGDHAEKEAVRIRPPFKVDEAKLDLSQLKAKGIVFKQYSRITVGIEGPGIFHTFLKNPIVQQYDIISVRPQDEKMMITISNLPECPIDILSFHPTEKASWLFKGRLVTAVLERGVCLELSYSCALADSDSRRMFLSNARQMIAASKKKNVLLTSGALKPIELRPPLDAANIFHLFGSDHNLGKIALSGNVEKALLKCQTKKTVKGAIFVQKIDSNSQNIDKLKDIKEFEEEFQPRV